MLKVVLFYITANCVLGLTVNYIEGFQLILFCRFSVHLLWRFCKHLQPGNSSYSIIRFRSLYSQMQIVCCTTEFSNATGCDWSACCSWFYKGKNSSITHIISLQIFNNNWSLCRFWLFYTITGGTCSVTLGRPWAQLKRLWSLLGENNIWTNGKMKKYCQVTFNSIEKKTWMNWTELKIPRQYRTLRFQSTLTSERTVISVLYVIHTWYIWQ